jgi:hypothetical protein
MLKAILTNEWFYSSIIGGILFFLLVDWKVFSVNVWGGIASLILELYQDGVAAAIGMYHFRKTILTLFDVPVFFAVGVAFTMGVLFLQYLPENTDLQFLHLLVFVIGFLIFEYIVTTYEMLVSPYWGLTASFFDNLLIFGSLLWLKQFVLYVRCGKKIIYPKK